MDTIIKTKNLKHYQMNEVSLYRIMTIIGIKHNEKAEEWIKTIQTQSKNIIHPHKLCYHV